MLSNCFGGFYSAPASLGSNDSQPLANLTSAGLTAAPVWWSGWSCCQQCHLSSSLIRRTCLLVSRFGLWSFLPSKKALCRNQFRSWTNEPLVPLTSEWFAVLFSDESYVLLKHFVFHWTAAALRSLTLIGVCLALHLYRCWVARRSLELTLQAAFSPSHTDPWVFWSEVIRGLERVLLYGDCLLCWVLW